jgi:hypothetical protein
MYVCAHITMCTCTRSALLAQGQDPLRFVRSFVRSHYAVRPIKSLATLCQMLVELCAAYDDLSEPPRNTGEKSAGKCAPAARAHAVAHD